MEASVGAAMKRRGARHINQNLPLRVRNELRVSRGVVGNMVPHASDSTPMLRLLWLHQLPAT